VTETPVCPEDQHASGWLIQEPLLAGSVVGAGLKNGGEVELKARSCPSRGKPNTEELLPIEKACGPFDSTNTGVIADDSIAEPDHPGAAVDPEVPFAGHVDVATRQAPLDLAGPRLHPNRLAYYQPRFTELEREKRTVTALDTPARLVPELGERPLDFGHGRPDIAASTAIPAYSLPAGDLDGDGGPDVAVTISLTNASGILLNNGDETRA
jgi:hypothetical protein